jgi:hypothetical protein
MNIFQIQSDSKINLRSNNLAIVQENNKTTKTMLVVSTEDLYGGSQQYKFHGITIDILMLPKGGKNSFFELNFGKNLMPNLLPDYKILYY